MKACVSIAAATERAALRSIRRADRLADVIELRLDRLPLSSLEKLVRACRKPVLATLRSKAEGGTFSGGAKRATRLLLDALDLGVDFVDVEFALPARLRARLLQAAAQKKTKVVLSKHFPDRTPPLPELSGLLAQMARVQGAAHCKVVTRARSIEDNGIVLSLHLAARRLGVSLIAHAMGPLGRVSRHLSPLVGASLAFACLDPGKATADGQPTVQALRAAKFPSVCAVAGRPIAHSLSPAMHNAAFKARKLDAVFLALEAESLDEAVNLAERAGFRGLSVTMPFKEQALRRADQTDPLARAIGAANTLVFRRGKILAFNTDCEAVVQALEQVVPLRGKKALVLGAGGMAKAAAIGLREKKCDVTIAARDPAKARDFCEANGLALRGLRGLHALDTDLLVNATPLGMRGQPGKLPLSARLLESGPVVLDCVYNPLRTPLLRAAEAKGCRTVSGLEVFVRQGAQQFELFTGKKAPVKAMRAAVQRRLRV